MLASSSKGIDGTGGTAYLASMRFRVLKVTFVGFRVDSGCKSIWSWVLGRASLGHPLQNALKQPSHSLKLPSFPPVPDWLKLDVARVGPGQPSMPDRILYIICYIMATIFSLHRACNNLGMPGAFSAFHRDTTLSFSN